MSRLAQLLTQYAAYHRDRRNIATHLAGVPMIVFSIVLALSVVDIPDAPIAMHLAGLASIATSLYYFRLDTTFGATLAGTLFVMCAIASEVTHRAGNGWALAAAAALFAAGWALQFWGHKFEGMKPAFFDDAKQLLIGPLFICAEVYFMMGFRPQLRRFIEERVGPTVARRTPVAPDTDSDAALPD